MCSYRAVERTQMNFSKTKKSASEESDHSLLDEGFQMMKIQSKTYCDFWTGV